MMSEATVRSLAERLAIARDATRPPEAANKGQATSYCTMLTALCLLLQCTVMHCTALHYVAVLLSCAALY